MCLVMKRLALLNKLLLIILIFFILSHSKIYSQNQKDLPEKKTAKTFIKKI